ncbi:Monocarboxylate transporter 2 [Liparis tanakae]|uniref:Monocarboxylate transporter 2 n=1 Tax=Liparis tanakae TaxID=230148 RepID=A0A4Z2EWJ2_9TELE|nr:Monocarboxylate transporter 2 [Liparis tanakae]
MKSGQEVISLFYSKGGNVRGSGASSSSGPFGGPTDANEGNFPQGRREKRFTRSELSPTPPRPPRLGESLGAAGRKTIRLVAEAALPAACSANRIKARRGALRQPAVSIRRAGGPISSILVNTYGCRPVVMMGGCLSATGMILASFSNTVMQLYICIGVIGGLGLAFNLQPALTMIGRYFCKKRPIANGLAMAGSPVFLSTLAPLNQYLFNQFGWRGSFLILGGLLLNCLVAGSLMRPLKPPPGKKDEEVAVVATVTKEKLTAWQTFNKYLDLSLFKHRGFLIYLSGNVIMFLGFFAPIVFLAAFAKDMGVDEYSAAFLLSILAFVDMVARPSMGLLANSRWVRPRIQYFFSFAVLYNGVCHMLCPLVENYTGLVVYAMFFGFAFGMVSSVLFETLMDIVGPQRFSSAVGLTTIVDIWLFIGNFINYRLLDRERKCAELYKRTETEDPDGVADPKEADGEAEASEELVGKSENVDEATQRETNI